MTTGDERQELPEADDSADNTDSADDAELLDNADAATALEDTSTADAEEAPEAPEAPEASPEPGVQRAVLLSRLESLIFTSLEPISARKLANILNMETKEVRELLAELEEHYRNRGIILEEISKAFQFRSHPDNAALIRDVFKLKPLKIGRAALETLAIVAYRQPLTRAEAEQIRGVDCGAVLKYLFEKNLVKVIGRKEEPGRPIIYGTTKEFLALFGLKALSDLPALHEFSELWDEHQKMVDDETPLVENGGTADKGEREDATDEEDVSGSEPKDAGEAMKEKEKANKAEKPDASEVPTESINPVELKELMDTINPGDFSAADIEEGEGEGENASEESDND